MDFSLNGLVAFPSQHVVVVCDSKSSRVIQTLNRHKCPVQRVRFPHDTSLKVASSDAKGCLLIWDITRSAVTTFILPGDRKETKGSRIVSFEWMPSSTEKKNQILVLYSSNLFVLFESDSGNVVSKRVLHTVKSPTHLTPSTFSLDPFSPSNVIIPLTPVNVNQLQCSFVHMESLFSQPSTPTHSSSSPIPSETNGIKMFRILVTDFIQSPSQNKSDPDLRLGVKNVINPLSGIEDEDSTEFKIEMKDVVFNRNQKNQVIVTSTRVIAMINISTHEIIHIIPLYLERNTSIIASLIPCRQRNALFSLHAKGSVSLRLLQGRKGQDSHEFMSTILAISPALPQNILDLQQSVIAFSVDPMNESVVALLFSSGRLAFLSLKRQVDSKNDVVKENDSEELPLSVSDLVPIKWYEFEEYRTTEALVFKKIAIVPSLSRTTVIKACPPVTRSNWEEHKPLLAVGSSTGSIFVINLVTGHTEKEMLLHLSAVRGIEWTSLTTFVSFSFLQDERSGAGTNELYLTDYTTGKSRVMRKEHASHEYSPIQAVRCSHLKQYLLVSFRDSSLEVWDLKTETLIKVLPDKFCGVSCIEWSPISSKQPAKTNESLTTNGDVHEAKKNEASRENFIVNDSSGDLYHFAVEGTVVNEVSQIRGDNVHGPLTAVAWKGDQVVLGFYDGSLLFWDLKKKASTTKSSTRDIVRKIKFAPGKGNPNFLVLYDDSLELWNHTVVQTDIKFMKDVIVFKVTDIDWTGSDRPVLLTSDSQILVTDLTLTRYSSPLLLERRLDKVKLSSNLHLIKDSVRFKLVASYIHDQEQLTAETIVKRCLDVSRCIGNKFLVDFWTLVSHHILGEEIDHSYDIFLKNQIYREIQKRIIDSFKSRRRITECVEFDLISGNFQQAVHTLLDSQPSSKPKYLTDCLKACLISAVSSSDASKESAEPVVKLVAASLIASGDVKEGVQLLLLMGKVVDACRHLQSHGLWEKSLWISKIALKEEDSIELVTRWLEHLATESHSHHQLVFALLTHHMWKEVLSLLMNRHEIQTAALFSIVCQMKGLNLNTNMWNASANKESSSEAVEYIRHEYVKLLQEHNMSHIKLPN